MADELARVRKAAYAMLARREYGCQELAQRLRDKGHEAPLIELVVAQLVAERMLSDERFVDAFVRSRSSRGYGPRRIEAELHQRGVDDELAEGRLAAGPSEECDDWVARAEQVRCRKFGEALPKEFPERARQMRYLEYRGFTHDQIRSVFKRKIK